MIQNKKSKKSKNTVMISNFIKIILKNKNKFVNYKKIEQNF